MLKRCLLTAALCASLPACGAVAGNGPPTVPEVQSIPVRDCAFLPTVEVIKKIIAAQPADLPTSAAIARAICTTIASTRRGTVAGVPIEGLKVR